MKNKLKLILPILAVIVGVAASAFTTDRSSYNTNSKAPSYYWFNTSNVYQDLNTHDNEATLTGCTGTSPICERGYTQSQLNNPNNPSQGVKSSQIGSPASQIFEK